MTDEPRFDWSEPDQRAVLAQLDRIFRSASFEQSRRRQRFLGYIVQETLAGRGDRIKGYNIAVEVFDRPEGFDGGVDPIVRVEAARLRDRLREFYEGDGRADPVRIELPKGSYTPHIKLIAALADDATPSGQHSKDAQNLAAPQPLSELPTMPSARFTRTQLGLLAAGVLLIASVGFWTTTNRGADPVLLSKPSIAVLPFDNIGDDPSWDRLAEGLTEDTIADLANSKHLIVIARNSTAVYKGKTTDVRQIGRDLKVKYVLAGSVQPMGTRIRVTAQLIEANTANQVWAERYDRPSSDLFEVQNAVTKSIVATLSGYEGAVEEAERRLIRRKPPTSLTAFDIYLLAVEAKHKVTKEGLIEAERLFNKALELDPQLARAHVGIVDTQFYLIDLGLAPSVDKALSKMMAAGEKAVALDPYDGRAHYALGLASLYNGKPELAATEFATAEALAPSDADMLLSIAWSIPGLGQSERAVNLAERALMLNPHYPDWYNQGLSYVFFFGDQYERSVKYRKLLKAPLAIDYAYLAMAYAYLNRTGEAQAAASNVRKLDPTWIAENYLSEGGGYQDREAELLVTGARKAGLSDCVPADRLQHMPSLIRVKSCDEKRIGTSN